MEQTLIKIRNLQFEQQKTKKRTAIKLEETENRTGTYNKQYAPFIDYEF